MLKCELDQKETRRKAVVRARSVNKPEFLMIADDENYFENNMSSMQEAL